MIIETFKSFRTLIVIVQTCSYNSIHIIIILLKKFSFVKKILVNKILCSQELKFYHFFLQNYFNTKYTNILV